MIDLAQNANTRAAALFVSALADSGLEAVCVAPGSRSTPLTLAFAQEPRVRIYRHLDERSAGFFALGLAKGSGRPVALVCTSGTAAANFHPAVVEARYAGVPLLVLTADRPPELRESGANQTIDQVKMFGDHVLWAADVVLAQEGAPPLVERYLASLAARAFALAGDRPPGPVHLNFPFRKPLQPESDHSQRTPVRVGENPPTPRISAGQVVANSEDVSRLAITMAVTPRGIIVCGPESGSPTFGAALRRLAEQTGYPILADALSGLRRGEVGSSALIMGGFDSLLQADPTALPDADIVLRFGSVPTSAAVNRYLAALPETMLIQISGDGVWADDAHITHTLMAAQPDLFCNQLVEILTEMPVQRDKAWADHFVERERIVWSAVAETVDAYPDSDTAAVWHLLNHQPSETSVLMAGNSLPVRLIDQLTRPSPQPTWLTGNRGASGIDGNVSAALGLASAGRGPVAALLGDITFYHDMNGLMAVILNQIPAPVFVILNNDGGGIFRRLPIATHEPETTDLFVMPHGRTFGSAAQMYGLSYQRLTASEFRDNWPAVSSEGASALIIELTTDPIHDAAAQAYLAASIRQHLAELSATEVTSP